MKVPIQCVVTGLCPVLAGQSPATTQPLPTFLQPARESKLGAATSIDHEREQYACGFSFLSRSTY